MEPALLVGLGGAIGAVLRYIVSGIAPRAGGIPSGTLLVNVIGSFVLSIMTFTTPQSSIIYLINIGMLGSFTTFSTFAYETFRLLEEGENRHFALNIILNVSLCITAIGVGYIVANYI